MGATYTRQSTFTDGDVITSDLFNNEYDQILAAFASSTGHTHDGTSAEGGPISKLLADSITIGTNTGDISFNFNAGSNDGVLTWMEDEDYFEFSDDVLIATTEKIQFRDTAIFINSSADGQLDIVADTEIQIAATTIDMNGAADISGNLNIGGNLTVAGDATVTGTTTFNGGTLTLGDAASDNVVFGADVNSSIIPNGANGSFDLGSSGQEWRDLFINGTAHIDTLDIDENATITGTLGVTGIATFTDDIIIGDGKTIGSASDVDAITIAANGQLTLTQTLIGTALDISGDIDIDGVTNLDVVDIDGAVDMASTLAVTGIATFTDDIIIGDGKTIGSTSDVDAITIASNGQVTLTQTLIGTALDISGDIDVDGVTNLDVVDIDGAVNIATTALVTGVLTTTATQVATGGITSGSNIVSDTDSTDDLGTTSVRWANLFVDGITATDQITATGFTGTLDGVLGSGTAAAATVTSLNTSAAVNLNLTTDSTSSTSGALIVDGGVGIAAKLFVGTDLDVDGTTNLDVVDIDGAVNMATTALVTGILTTTAATVFNGGFASNADSTMGTNKKLIFRDSDIHISSVSDGDLMIAANDEIDLTSTLIDINGNVEISGNTTQTGVITANAGVVVDEMTLDADTLTATDDFILDVAGNIEINADGGTVTFKDDSSSLGTITSSGYSGTSAKVTVSDSTANTNFPVVFHNESDALLDDTGALRYNPSTGQLLVPNLTVAGTTTTVDTVTMNAENAIVFEGATADAHETTLTIIDPTADRTINLPNQSGTIPVLAAASNTAVSSTPEELNLLDTASANSVVNSKAVIYGSSGELAGVLSTAGQTNVTSLGTLTALTVDDVAIDGKVITMTGSSSDTAVFTAAANGAFSLVTTDAGGAAANIQITADGTAELAGTTVTLDSAGDIDLAATDDINVPSGVGMTFGADGEKIEGDGTDLAINSSGDLNVTATTVDINATTVEISGATTQTGISTSAAIDIFNAGLSVKNASASGGFVQFFESGGTSNIKVIAPALAADATLTLPAVAGIVATEDLATALAIALG